MKRVRILIADDHRIVSDGLKKILEPEFEVVASVGDGRSLVTTALELRPDVVLTDVTMPVLSGLDAGRELKKLMPNVKLIFLTMNRTPEIARDGLRIGAAGYLLKSSHGEELLMAIRAALRGVSYVSPQIREALDEMFIRDPNFLDAPNHLSNRERDVLQLLAEGRPMQGVASALLISPRTVKFHKHQIMDKLGFTTNSELIQYAIKHGMLVPL